MNEEKFYFAALDSLYDASDNAVVLLDKFLSAINLTRNPIQVSSYKYGQNGDSKIFDGSQLIRINEKLVEKIEKNYKNHSSFIYLNEHHKNGLKELFSDFYLLHKGDGLIEEPEEYFGIIKVESKWYDEWKNPFIVIVEHDASPLLLFSKSKRDLDYITSKLGTRGSNEDWWDDSMAACWKVTKGNNKTFLLRMIEKIKNKCEQSSWTKSQKAKN